MAIDLETIRAKLTLDARDYQAGLARAHAETGRFRTGLATTIGGVVNFGAKLGFATFGLQQLARTARGAMDALFSGNFAIERTRAQLTAFTGSAEAADALLRQIREEAQQTPFAFQEMAAATAMLVPAARQAGVDVMDLVREAEILAAVNPAEGLEGAAFSLREALSGDFVSIVERFNLPRQRLNELKEQGVPALEAVRITMRELGIDASLVANLAQTNAGRIDRFVDILSNIKTTAMAAAFELLGEALDGIGDWLEANQARLEQTARTLGERLANALRRLAHWARDNRERLVLLATTIVRVVTTAFRLLSRTLETVQRHSETLRPVVAGLVAAFLTLQYVIPAIQAVRAAIVGLRVALFALNPWMLAIAAVVALFAAAWLENWFNIREQTRRVVGVLLTIGRRIIGIFKGGRSLSAAIADLPRPIQKVAILVRRLLAVGLNFYRAWRDGGPVAAFRQFSRDLTKIGRTLGNLFQSLGFARFGAQIKTTFGLIGQVIRDVVAIVAAIVAGDWPRVWRLFVQLVRHVVLLVVSLIRQIPALIADVGALMLRVFAAIPWGTIGAALWAGMRHAGLFLVRRGIPWLLERGWQLLRALARGAINAAREHLWPWLRSVPGRVIDFLKSVPGRLYEAGARWFGRLMNGVSLVWNTVLVPWLTTLPDRFLGFLAGLPGRLWSVGWDAIQGLWNGIAARWDSFVSWLSGKFESLPKPLRKALEIFSPSRVFARLGEMIPAGFALGIERGLPRIEAMVSAMAETASGRMALPEMAGAARGPAVVNVTVNGVTEPERAADLAVRKLLRALDLVDAGR